MERSTRQRRVIQDIFSREGRPLGPQDVLKLAQESLPDLGIATVYRTIRSLGDSGWLRSVEMPGLGTLYETGHAHHHHHFHCTNCGKVYEIEGCSGGFEALLPQGFSLDEHEIILRGTCAHCAQKA